MLNMLGAGDSEELLDSLKVSRDLPALHAEQFFFYFTFSKGSFIALIKEEKKFCASSMEIRERQKGMAGEFIFRKNASYAAGGTC